MLNPSKKRQKTSATAAGVLGITPNALPLGSRLAQPHSSFVDSLLMRAQINSLDQEYEQ